MPTQGYEHFVGAYGVVGFSGVKDARERTCLPTLCVGCLRLQEGYRSTTWRLQ